MTYNNNSELPKGVRNHLPNHAQDIYRSAFNHAWVEYSSPEKRRSHDSREVVSHKVAWSAVEKKYKKNADGIWVLKDPG